MVVNKNLWPAVGRDGVDKNEFCTCLLKLLWNQNQSITCCKDQFSKHTSLYAWLPAIQMTGWGASVSILQQFPETSVIY